MVEATISGLFTFNGTAWTVWTDARGKRDHQPAFVALHMPERLIVAVFVRPRKLHPSEQPDVSWLPAGWQPVVWHPGLSKDISAWLAAPAGGDPPGTVIATLRSGSA